MSVGSFRPEPCVGSSGRIRRWPETKISSITSVSTLFNEFAERQGTVRVGGPITSLVLSSVLDTSKRDLQRAGVVASIETDRRDDRRDGWTIDRVSLAGRWMVCNNRLHTFVCGSTAGGPPAQDHEVWAAALRGRRPEELDVQVWQRTDRTTWVLHDGDGQVLAEFVIDEQRRMGTHESTVDVRLMHSAEVNPLCEEVAVLLDEFLKQTSSAPVEAPPVAKVVLPAPVTPLRRANDLTAPLWAIRAAVDVETMTRRYQPEHISENSPSTNIELRELPALAALIGSLAELRVRHPIAAAQLESFCDDLVAAERCLIRCADEAWAARRLTNSPGAKLEWTSLMSDSSVGLRLLQPHSASIRSLVLTMLERTDSELVGSVNADHLAGSIAAWSQHSRSVERAGDNRRAASVRAAISAYRFSVESSNVATDGVALTMQRANQLDVDLRWLRRRAAMVELVQRGTDAFTLPAKSWMQLGVAMSDVERRIDNRLALTRKHAQRVRQVLVAKPS
jgi:hypothetical protein